MSSLTVSLTDDQWLTFMDGRNVIGRAHKDAIGAYFVMLEGDSYSIELHLAGTMFSVPVGGSLKQAERIMKEIHTCMVPKK